MKELIEYLCETCFSSLLVLAEIQCLYMHSTIQDHVIFHANLTKQLYLCV